MRLNEKVELLTELSNAVEMEVEVTWVGLIVGKKRKDFAVADRAKGEARPTQQL